MGRPLGFVKDQRRDGGARGVRRQDRLAVVRQRDVAAGRRPDLDRALPGLGVFLRDANERGCV
jgi:hypothetical protein